MIEHARRKILHFNVTRHPSADWVVQQLRAAFPEAGPYRYVILDREQSSMIPNDIPAGDRIDTQTNQRAGALAE